MLFLFSSLLGILFPASWFCSTNVVCILLWKLANCCPFSVLLSSACTESSVTLYVLLLILLVPELRANPGHCLTVSHTLVIAMYITTSWLVVVFHVEFSISVLMPGSGIRTPFKLLLWKQAHSSHLGTHTWLCKVCHWTTLTSRVSWVLMGYTTEGYVYEW